MPITLVRARQQRCPGDPLPHHSRGGSPRDVHILGTTHGGCIS